MTFPVSLPSTTLTLGRRTAVFMTPVSARMGAIMIITRGRGPVKPESVVGVNCHAASLFVRAAGRLCHVD